MFYSHDILGRRGPLGFIWSMAHGKKISKQKLMGIHLSDICMRILAPDVPHSLRLQGILIGGVTLVFARQQQYLLEDLNSMVKHVREATSFAAVQQGIMSAVLKKGKDRVRSDLITLDDHQLMMNPHPDLNLAGEDALFLTFPDEMGVMYDGDLDMDLFLVPSAPAADSSGRTGSKRVADTDAAADIMAKKVCPRSFPSNQEAVPNERCHGGSRGYFLTVSDKDEVEFAAGNDSLKISRRGHLNSEHHLRGGIFEKEEEEGSQIDYHDRDVEEDDNLQLHNQSHTMMDSSADCRHQAGGDPLLIPPLLPLQHTATKSRFMMSSAHHQYTVAHDLCQDQPASRSLLSIAGLSSSVQGSDALLRGISQDEYRKYGLGNRYNHQALPTTHNVEDEDMFLPTAAHGEEEEALLDLMAVMRSGSSDLINQKSYTAAAALSYDVNVPPALPDAGEDKKDEISCPSNAPVKIMKATNAKRGRPITKAKALENSLDSILVRVAVYRGWTLDTSDLVIKADNRGNHKEDQQGQLQAGLCEVDQWAVKEGTTFRLALMQPDMTMSEEMGRIFGHILLRPSAASKQAAVVRSDSGGGGGATSQHLCEPQHANVKERKVQGMKMNNKKGLSLDMAVDAPCREGQQLDSSSQIMTDEESEVEMERMRGITLEDGGGGYGMLLTPGSQRGIMATAAAAAGSHAHQALMAGHRGSSSAFKGSADAHSNRSSSGIGSPESDPHLLTREGLLLMPPRLRTARRPHHGGGGGGNTSLLSPIHDEMMKDDDDGVMYCDQQQQLLPLLPADDDDLMFIGGHADEEVAYRKQPCLEGSRRSIKQDHDHGDQQQRGLLSFGQGFLEDLLPNEDNMPVHDNIGRRCDRPDVTNDESYGEAAVAARYWSHPSYPSHPSDPAFKLAESYGTGTQQIKQNTVSGDNGGIMNNTTLMVLRIIKGRLVQKQRMTRQMKNVTAAASDCSSRQKGHLMTNKEDAASGYDDDHHDDDMDVQQQQQSSDDTTVSFFELVKGLRRYEAIKLFYQLMCTHTTSYLKVQQDTSYGDLHISAGPLLS